jgi:hypothetical protein
MSTVKFSFILVPELQGDANEIAIEKAKIAYEQTKKAVLV